MSDQDSWQVELTVAPGELDNFRTLTEMGGVHAGRAR